MNCSRCYNNGFSADSHAMCLTSLSIDRCGFDTYYFPIFDEHSFSGTTHNDARTMVVCILEVGLHCGLFAPITATKATEATALLAAKRVVAQHIGLKAKRITSINK